MTPATDIRARREGAITWRRWIGESWPEPLKLRAMMCPYMLEPAEIILLVMAMGTADN